MRAVRWTVLVAALVLAAPLAAQQAPPGGRPGGMRGDPAEMQRRQNEVLFKNITLTPAQRTKVDSIQAAARARQQELMQAGGMRNPDTRAQMMQQRQETLSAIRAQLTSEQQTVFDANVATLPAAAGGGRPPRP